MKKPFTYLAFLMIILSACQKTSDDAPWCGTGMHETAEPSVFPYDAAITIDIDYRPGKVYYHQNYILLIDDRSLKAYSANNGDLQWQWKSKDDYSLFPQSLSFYGSNSDKILVQGLEGLYALELNSGAEIWSNFTHPNQRIANSAVIEGKVYRLSNFIDRGYLVESRDLGTQDWDTVFNRSSVTHSNLRSDEIRFYTSSLGVPMAVLIQTDFNSNLNTVENTAFKINLSTTTADTLLTTNEGLTAVDVIEGQFVYQSSPDQKVFAYDLQTENQQQIGSNLMGRDGSQLYFLASENNVQVFDLATGNTETTLEFDYELRPYGFRANENMAAFYNGAMYAVTPDTDLAFKNQDGVSNIWGAEKSSSEPFGYRRAGMEFLTAVNETNGTFVAVRYNKLYLIRF